MFYDFITNTLIFFEKKKAFHIFFHTNIGEFLMLTIEILTKRELTTSLVLNNRTQEDSATDWKNLYLNIKVNEYTFREGISTISFCKIVYNFGLSECNRVKENELRINSKFYSLREDQFSEGRCPKESKQRVTKFVFSVKMVESMYVYQYTLLI